MKARKIAILGSVGVPANYGGFETLVENLVKFHNECELTDVITVYCSSKSYPKKEKTFLSARLKYIPIQANGASSIPYDIISMISAIWNRSDVVLLLGVSGAMALPFVRLFSSAKIFTNIDGIEWRREKWGGFARRFLRFSELMAVHFSHGVISDNGAIAEYVKRTYGIESQVIAYGGDHAVEVDAASVHHYGLPEGYAFSVCRIEPENNMHIVLDAFSKINTIPLVAVGNWNNSEYGRSIRDRFSKFHNLFLIDPIYDLGMLKTLRQNASIFVHGHSAGGTNPSLVEAMHFGKAIFAFDCDYNRATTENKTLYFYDSDGLKQLISVMSKVELDNIGRNMFEIACRRYTWRIIARDYYSLLGS